jgi:alkanesulfonate monooxygenase SsuD/methylene tetrahydromethanopterin reductase-like flavin-dependent oxidoreductase (luciferase family)
MIGARKPRMLRLTAEYADAWNTCWLGHVSDIFHARRTEFLAACTEVGRDPTSIKVTVGVRIDFEPPPVPAGPDDALSGSDDEIATALQAWAKVGADHVICHLSPITPRTLQRFAAIVRTIRR